VECAECVECVGCVPHKRCDRWISTQHNCHGNGYVIILNCQENLHSIDVLGKDKYSGVQLR